MQLVTTDNLEQCGIRARQRQGVGAKRIVGDDDISDFYTAGRVSIFGQCSRGVSQ